LDARDITLYSVAHGAEYAYFQRAWWRSAQRNAPDHRLELSTHRALPNGSELPEWVRGNAAKLEEWVAWAEARPDGAAVVLMDADTLVLGPLTEAFAVEYDCGYTVRPAAPGYNLGVVFLRLSRTVRAFLRRWLEEDRTALAQAEEHGLEPIEQFHGLNQLSFSRARMAGASQRMTWQPLDCAIWNAEQSTYPRVGGLTRVLHVKNWLRDSVLHAWPVPEEHMEEAERLVPMAKEYLG